jgi:hypothetical protein
LLVAQGEEVAVGGEGVAGLVGIGGVGGLWVWGGTGGLIVEGLALGGDALHVVVFIAEAFPAFVVLLPFLVAFVSNYCFMG